MNISDQGRLKRRVGLGLTLASTALPALPGCASQQSNYIGAATQVLQGSTRIVSYREEELLPGIPSKGTLTVSHEDGSLLVYHDNDCDGCLDGKDVYGPSHSRRFGEDLQPPKIPADEKPVYSKRWIKLSRLNILSVVTDLVGEYFPNPEHQAAENEYRDWLTWLGGQKRDENHQVREAGANAGKQARRQAP